MPNHENVEKRMVSKTPRRKNETVGPSQEKWGKAILRWRLSNIWINEKKQRVPCSQQVPHEWAQAYGVTFYNSQIAYAERGTHEPKGAGFFLGFAAFNKALSEQNFSKVKDKKTRERLKACNPYLNAQGNVATATDLFGQYCGELEINEVYTRQEELTDELSEEWGEKLIEVFDQMARDCMLDGPRMWKQLKSTKDFPESKELQSILQDVLRGELKLNKDHIISVAKTCHRCPVFYAFVQYAETNENVNQNLIKELTPLNTRIESLAKALV
tara:strand:- start:802 stop:1614 length:813 start_codon:yes stop_codon:yes gene_type:complete